jgi:hypothetical protein
VQSPFGLGGALLAALVGTSLLIVSASALAQEASCAITATPADFLEDQGRRRDLRSCRQRLRDGQCGGNTLLGGQGSDTLAGKGQ